MTGTRPADYSLGIDDAEEARLVAQCEDHRREAEQLLDRIGLPPGARALDLGCGPLGILDVLADQVGPSGSVVGVDREPRGLAMAARQLGARGLSQVQLVETSADATGLADGSVEPTELDERLRRVAEHLADPTTSTLHPTLFTAWGRRPG